MKLEFGKVEEHLEPWEKCKLLTLHLGFLRGTNSYARFIDENWREEKRFSLQEKELSTIACKLAFEMLAPQNGVDHFSKDLFNENELVSFVSVTSLSSV